MSIMDSLQRRRGDDSLLDSLCMLVSMDTISMDSIVDNTTVETGFWSGRIYAAMMLVKQRQNLILIDGEEKDVTK